MSATEPPASEGYTIVPIAAVPPTADEALTLEQQLADPSALDATNDPPVPLGRTPAIDFALRNFVPGTAGGPLMLYGTDTLKQWVEKCCRTRRGENPAVNPDFGLDRLFSDLIDGSPYDESAAAEFEAIVERALSVHPAIDSIDGFTIDYTDDDDAAFVQFTIIRTDDGQDPLDIDLTLPATGAHSA